MRGEPEEIDSEVLLRQGHELLRSSRRLLDELGDIGSPEGSPADADGTRSAARRP